MAYIKIQEVVVHNVGLRRDLAYELAHVRDLINSFGTLNGVSGVISYERVISGRGVLPHNFVVYLNE